MWVLLANAAAGFLFVAGKSMARRGYREIVDRILLLFYFINIYNHLIRFLNRVVSTGDECILDKLRLRWYSIQRSWKRNLKYSTCMCSYIWHVASAGYISGSLVSGPRPASSCH